MPSEQRAGTTQQGSGWPQQHEGTIVAVFPWVDQAQEGSGTGLR